MRVTPSLFLALALWVVATSAPGQMPDRVEDYPAQSAQVVHADGRRSAATLKQLEAPAKEWFLSGSDLADILQVGRYWRNDVRKLVLRVGDQRVTFTVGARAVVASDQAIMLRRPVLFHQGEPWIPMEFVTAVLPQLSELMVTFDERNFALRLGERQFNVTGLRIVPEELQTELRIQMVSPLAFRVDDSRARRLIIKVYGGQGDRGRLRIDQARGLVDAVEARQENGDLLLDVQLSELASRYQSLASDDGKTIILRIEQAPISTIPEPVPRGPHLVQTLPAEAKGRRVQVRKVVIDAGHGGVDHGREGVNGLQEKDVTLAIAQEIQRILQRRNDIDVVLTRNTDESMGLVERTEVANRERGDLFISIHCNGWYDARAKGVETYFLSPAKTEWDASVARAENSTVAAAEDLDFILWDLVQNVFIQESATLAEAVQARLANDLQLRNRGVKQAGFRVLVGAFMPAILVEVGFLSNTTDAGRLATASFQRDTARAIADAILDFRKRMDAVREESR